MGSTHTNSARYLVTLNPLKFQRSTKRRENETFAIALKGIAITNAILLLLKP